MKFRNGCWLLKEGFTSFSPKQVYDYAIEEKKAVLCMPTSPVQGRGDTLDTLNLTIRVSAPMPEMIRVQVDHHKGVRKREPEFELNDTEEQALTVEESGNLLIVKNGHLSLIIDKTSAHMRYERDGKLLTQSMPQDLSYLKEDWKGLAYDKGGGAYMCQRLTLSVNELIYGMGERFGAFVKNGQSVSIWNEDGGTSSEQSYKNIPFYLSNRGYGVFVNHSERVEFEVGSEQVNKVAFSVEGEHLDYYFISGADMKEVLVRYTDLTGKPSLPAPWTFGLWLSTSFTTDYDEETVMSFIDGMFERGIPLSVFHFDCGWMKSFHWTDFIWDEKIFPDPCGMLSRIKEKGIKVCVWINSYIAQESVLFDIGMEKGYFLKRPNGDVWQWDMWQPGLAIVDFTNPEAKKWYQGQLERLLDMGVDCFKTDFGERIPTDVVYYNGADAEKMHNFYTYLYNQAVYEVLERKKGKKEAVLFARSATAGGQKFPVHWGGDCFSDYESMEQSLRGGLSLANSGFGFWSHDIGGFEGKATPDVYKRWCAFGLLSTHSRLHGSSSYRVPWLFDEESVEVLRYFTGLKASLMPYLYRNAVETSRTGIPMMRSMALEFPQDRNCAYLAAQYMLGDSLLVAPVMNEEGIAEYYLPEGIWTNFLTDEVKEGGRWYREKHSYMSIPLYVRAGSIIAVGGCAEQAVYDYAKEVTYKVYALPDGQESSTAVYSENNEAESAIFVKRAGGTYSVEVKSDKPCKVELLKAGTVADVKGADYTVCGDKIMFALEKGRNITVVLKVE